MATLPKIIRTFQPFDGRDEATLTQHGRVIREAGLIPGGKRGVGAPHMTARHAAILLLGIYGSATPKDGPTAVDQLGDLRSHYTTGPMENAFEPLVGDTLVDTFESLIERTPELINYLFDIVKADRNWTEEQLAVLREQMSRGGGLIDFTVELGNASAEIRANWGHVELLRSIFMVDPDRLMAGEYNARMNGDRQVSIKFTLRTITALYEAVSGDLIQIGGEG